MSAAIFLVYLYLLRLLVLLANLFSSTLIKPSSYRAQLYLGTTFFFKVRFARCAFFAVLLVIDSNDHEPIYFFPCKQNSNFGQCVFFVDQKQGVCYFAENNIE